MLKQPSKYLLLAAFTAILALSAGCTNVTETPPNYVISTPRIPHSPTVDATQSPVPTSALGSPTPITKSPIKQAAVMSTAPNQTIPQLTNLTPQQILESKIFEAGPLTESLTPSRGGALKIATNFDIPTLDPRQLATGGTMVLGNFVYEGFFRYDQGTERDPLSPAILPAMAYKWDFREEGTELVLKLNSGIHWGNIDNPVELGPEITASDYVYTLNSYKDNSSLYKFYESLESAEVQDRYTLKLNFSRPSFWIIPFFASSMGIQFNPFLADAEKLDMSMIGPGPFILDTYESKSQATLLRNPHYYRKDYRNRSLPYLGSVQFIYAADRETSLALLKASKVHIAEIALSPQEIDAVLASNPGLDVSLEIPTGIQNSIALQLDNLNWSSKEARRALALVTDGKGISDSIFGNFGMPTDKFEWWYWSETLPSWEDDLATLYGPYNNHTDVEKAQILWEREGTGNIAIKLNYYPHTEAYTEIVASVQQDWRQLGITVQPVPLTYPEYNTALRQRTSVDAILATQSSAPNLGIAAYNRAHSRGLGNREGIDDQVVDSLVNQLTNQPVGAMNRLAVQQLRQHLNNQVYWISLPSVAFMSGTIFRTTVHGIPSGNHSSARSFYQGKVLTEAWIE